MKGFIEFTDILGDMVLLNVECISAVVYNSYKSEAMKKPICRICHKDGFQASFEVYATFETVVEKIEKAKNED